MSIRDFAQRCAEAARAVTGQPRKVVCPPMRVTRASGTAMVLDDYRWKRYLAQKKAFDRFTQAHDTMVLGLPTGQGLIIKP